MWIQINLRIEQRAGELCRIGYRMAPAQLVSEEFRVVVGRHPLLSPRGELTTTGTPLRVRRFAASPGTIQAPGDYADERPSRPATLVGNSRCSLKLGSAAKMRS